MEVVEIREEVMTFDESKKLLGEWPIESHIQQWFDPQVDTKYILSNFLGETILAGIKKRVYTGEKYEEIKSCLMSIDDTTTMRASCSGPIDIEDRGWKEIGKDDDKLIYEDKDGQKYQLRTDNSFFVLGKGDKQSGVAQANPIHSVMIGFKRGRLTGKMAESNWSIANRDRNDILSQIPEINDVAYKEIAPVEYNFQKSYVESGIESKYRINGGIHTTLSANKYSSDGSQRMSYHIDSGDLDGGLTTIATFLEGNVKTYFVLPRFGIAVSRGDGDVFVGDSGQVHGVIDVEGEGISMNCVSYCDTRLATQSNKGKPEKLIGASGKKTRPTLEGFM